MYGCQIKLHQFIPYTYNENKRKQSMDMYTVSKLSCINCHQNDLADMLLVNPASLIAKLFFHSSIETQFSWVWFMIFMVFTILHAPRMVE